jgi:thiol reductant ABC exporter CydC subunit
MSSADLADVRRLLRMSRPVAWRLVGASLLGSGTALAAIGLIATSAYLISRASEQPPILTLTVAIVGVRFFGISRGLFRYLERVVGHDAAFRVLTDVRVDVYRRLEQLAPSGLPAFRSGDLLARLVGDVDDLQELYLRVLPPYAVFVVAGSVSVAVVGWLVPAAGLALLVGFLVGGILVPAVAAAAGARAERQVAGARGEMSASVVELVQAVPELVLAGTARRRLDHLDAVDDRLRRSEQRVAGAAGLGSGLTTLVAGLTVTTAFLLGARAVDSGALDGVMLAVVVLTPLAAFELVTPLPMAAQLLSRVRASARRVFDVLDADLPVREPAHPATPPPWPATVRLDGVSARWRADSDEALRGIDLVLPPGARVAVVGPSGSGKSTLASVLLRFLDPSAGTVRWGDVDAADLASDDVRLRVGLLAQDAHVFDSSLAENLRLARRDATSDELRQALAAAQLLGWVDSLPLGLETLVGEHGARLSGGQRQRLALARVLLADFPVVVLDEPGEHLDTPTADALMTDLLTATAGRTTVVISHRVSGLAVVDEVVVLAEGGVVERGGHGDLLAHGGWYARQWQREQEVDRLLSSARLRTLGG